MHLKKNCGGGDNSNSPKKQELSVNIWSKEYVTSSDVQGFSYCQLRDTQSKRKL